MKLSLFILSLLTLIGTSSLFADYKNIIPSRPGRVTIYRDGYGYLQEKLTLEEVQNVSIQLPAQTDVASIRIFIGENYLSGFSVKPIRQKVEKEDKLMGYLLSFPEKGQALRNKTLLLKYGSYGISWEPQLDVAIKDPQKASLAMTAMISNTALDMKDCDIYLASGSGSLSVKYYYEWVSYYTHRSQITQTGRSADIIYPIGRHTLEKERTTSVTFQTGQSSYEIKYLWNTDTRNPIQSVLMVDNPFNNTICPTKANLFKKNLLTAQDNVEGALPGRKIFMSAGTLTNITVHRFTEMKENLNNKTTRFNHTIRFTVTNPTDKAIRLEVLTSKKYSYQHKTLYHFKKAPDRRPGNLLIWELLLKNGQTEVIDFNFDSDQARYYEYQSYERRMEFH